MVEGENQKKTDEQPWITETPPAPPARSEKSQEERVEERVGELPPIGGPPPIPAKTDRSGNPPAKDSATSEETWGLLIHLSTLVGYTGLAFLGASVVAPLIIWILKKDGSAVLDEHGKEAINFNITVLIWTAALFVFGFLTLGFGFFLFPILGLYHVGFSVYAAVQANEGRSYRYPMTLRLIK